MVAVCNVLLQRIVLLVKIPEVTLIFYTRTGVVLYKPTVTWVKTACSAACRCCQEVSRWTGPAPDWTTGLMNNIILNIIIMHSRQENGEEDID